MKKILEEIKYMENHTSNFLRKYMNLKTKFPIPHLLIQVLERYSGNMKSLHVLIQDDVFKHMHACGLIMRNIMSDMHIIGTFLLFEESDKDLEYYCWQMLFNDIRFTDSLMTSVEKLGFPKSLQNAFEETIHDWKNYEGNDFIKKNWIELSSKKPNELSEADGNDNHYKPKNEFNNINNKVLFETILKCKKEDQFAHFLILNYLNYSTLSKFEHLGWNSYTLTRKLDHTNIKEFLTGSLKPTVEFVNKIFERIEKTENQLEL